MVFRFVITRCGNLYGGGDLNFNRIIPQTIQLVLEGKAPEIRSDGTFIRDYFYIEDAVKAYLLLAEKWRKKGLQEKPLILVMKFS